MPGSIMLNPPTANRRFGAVRLALLGTAATFLMAGAAAAQDTQVDEVMVTAPHYVPTVNTSATKTAVPLIETPGAVTVVTRDQIDLLGMANLQQAVRYTAGALGETFGADSRFDWLTVRGFAPVEFIDGIQAPIGSVSTVGLDLWAADSVEILKGPAGVLYGATPPGGIVNVTTRRPQDDFHGSVQGLLGSFQNRQIAGDVTGPIIDGKLDFRLTGLYRKSDTQIDHADVERSLIAPSLTWNIDDNTHLTLLSFYQKDSNHGGDGGFLPAAGTLLANPHGKISVSTNVGEPGINFFGRELYSIGYEFNHKFNDHITVVQDLKYLRQDENFISVYGGGLQADLHTLNRNYFAFPEDTKVFGVDTRAEITGNTGAFGHNALVGVDYRNVKYQTRFAFGFQPAALALDIYHPVYGAAYTPPALGAPSKTNSEQVGVYAQDTIKYENVRLTLNAREDKLSGAVDDSHFTWRAGLNYIFPSGLAPYVAYSTSFQPITGADFSGKTFQPTTGKQVEGGVKFEPRQMPRYVKWFASAAVFQLDQDNVLVNDPDHLFFSVQTGHVRVKGVELESVARIKERLTINASYSYTDSPFAAVPKNKAALLVDYTFQTGMLGGLGGGAGVRYLGESPGSPAAAPAETLVDLLVHYDFKDWRLALNANNIADKVYVQNCSSVDSCFYSQRRNVTVSLTKKW
jgi:iron complex outermembrane receptor protein